jgi:propanediol utilization protein
MKVPIAISARHVHLNQDDLNILFGEGYQLRKCRDLSQPGEFAGLDTVTIRTEKDEIKNVRIVGPIRNYTQVEISKTDSYKLGINPPVRNSGDLENAALVKIIGPCGIVEKKCCIIANRHIHIDKKDLEKYDLKDDEKVKVKIISEKSTIFENVYIKSGDNYVFELHIDLDDANGSLTKQGDYGHIIKGD